MKRLFLMAAVMVCGAGFLQTAQAGEYKVDAAHSGISFQVRHIVTKVNGRFQDFTATLAFDPKRPTKSKVSVEIDVNSLTTFHPKRDGHLKSADFFDVAKYPKIKFESTKISGVKRGKGGQISMKVHGNLTIKDKTNPVVLDVQYTGERDLSKMKMGIRAGFHAKTTIDRHKFGVSYGLRAIIGSKIQISIDIEATKAK